MKFVVIFAIISFIGTSSCLSILPNLQGCTTEVLNGVQDLSPLEKINQDLQELLTELVNCTTQGPCKGVVQAVLKFVSNVLSSGLIPKACIKELLSSVLSIVPGL